MLPPKDWYLQYWDAATSAWTNVTLNGGSTYSVGMDKFNSVTFNSVTTSKLRAVFDTGYTGTCTGACHAVGVIQWVAAGS